MGAFTWREPSFTSLEMPGCFRNEARETQGHDPTRHVDDLADAQIARNRAQYIVSDSAHIVLLADGIDHAHDRLARRLEKIGTDVGRRYIALAFQMTRHRSPRGEARESEIGA